MTAYPFTDRSNEHHRLIAQGSVFDPLTARLLEEAGLAPGMRVLDIGCGAGNVTRLAAEIVGPGGSVVGIDAEPAAVELARAATPMPNVEFGVADVTTLDGVEGSFDAVVGRLVLAYLPDPVAALGRIAKQVRPGGLVCMHEGDVEYLPCGGPALPLWTQAQTWLLDALRKAGLHTRLGPALFTAFCQAGLPAPRLLMECYAQGGPEAAASVWARFVSSAVPLMEKHGVATRAEVDPDTLADRLLAETLAADGCVIGPPMTGAWTRV